MEKIPETWLQSIRAGDYRALVEQTAITSTTALDKKLLTAKWHANACRALGEGANANSALLEVAQGKFSASAQEIAAYAEEMVQCAYYEVAGRFAEMLEGSGAVQADYIWAMLWREREDWTRYEAALEKLKQRVEPWKTLANIQASWAAMRQGRIALAESLLAPLAQENHPGIRKLLVRLDLTTGNWGAARQRLEFVAKEQPLDWEWPALLAAALMPSALARGKDEIKQDPDGIGALFELALARQPRQPETLLNRARWKLAHGDVQGAENDCNAALALKPWFDAPVLLWVERAVIERDYDLAQAILEKARRHLDTPKRAGASLDLMRLKGAKKQELIAAAQRLATQFPGDANALRTAGAALQTAKKYDQAATQYAQSLSLVPEDATTRNNLALLNRDRGDLDEAVRVWRGITSGMNDSIRVNYALILLQRGDMLEAETIFTSILLREPKHAAALRGMAEIHFAAGEDDRAWTHALDSLRIDVKNPLAWTTASGIARRREGEASAIGLLEQGEAHARPVLPVRQALFQRWRGILKHTVLQEKVAVWCNSEPGEVDYWLMAADAAYDFNEFEHCETNLHRAQECDLDRGSEALVRFYLRRDRQGAARRVAEQLVRSDPQTVKNWGLLAEVMYRQERYSEAHEAIDTGLKKEPMRLSLVRMKIGFHLAKEEFDAAIAIARKQFDVECDLEHLSLLVGTLRRAQRHVECVEVVESMLQKNPRDRMLRLMQAGALRRAGQHDASLAVLERIYDDEPGNFSVVQRYARALTAADRLPEAITVLNQLAEKSSYRPDLTVAIAELMIREGAGEAAGKLLAEGLSRSPTHLELWLQKAQLHKNYDDIASEMQTWREVLTRFPARRWASAIPNLVRLGLLEPMQDALNVWRAAEPGNPEPWWAALRVAKETKNYRLALLNLMKIEELRGPNANVNGERAAIFQEQWKLSDAIAELRKAITLRPDAPDFYEQLLNIEVKAGNFDEFDELMSKLEHMLGDQRYLRYANFFFNINCHPTWSASEVWRFYRDWYVRAIKPNLPAPILNQNTSEPTRRLRIGYVSPDFRRHAVAYFSEPLLIEHDRAQFELFAYAHLEPNTADQYTERFKSYFHHWTEIRSMSDGELERRIRDDGIDILIDLAGHTSNNRLKLFIRKPAPVQASWIWGAGQTTGLPQVDYFLTDSASVPPEHDAYMAEKVARMSRPGLPFMPAHDVLEPTALPCLVNGFITFGVLARPLRTNRNTVALWAKILHSVPKSILRFDHVPYAEADVQQRLLGYFAEHGITEDRLQFRNTRPHWQVYQEIDLQLDPFPAGSGTTASEGLYMERLVVTLKSRPPMGLIAHGQLEAMGLDELCTADTEDEYVEKATALVNDFHRLAELSTGLRESMKNSWLMDYAGYGREVAVLYRQMWRDWCAKQAGGGA